MSKKNLRKRKEELFRRKQGALDSMQSTFVDADVLINAITNENSSSFKFFESFRGKNRKILTSTHSIGEVVKFLYRIAGEEKHNPDYDINGSILAFKGLLDITNIEIVNFSENSGSILDEKVLVAGDRLEFKDALNVALAYENGCHSFCTFDKGITEETLRILGMKRLEP